MAEKALFHKVTFKDVNGEWNKVYPARAAANLISELGELPHVNVHVDCLGWHTGEFNCYERADGFRAVIEEKEIIIGEDEIGFDYLKSQFPKEYEEFCQKRRWD